MSLNKVMLIGNVGKEPEVKQTDNGKVAVLSLGITEKYKDRNGEKKENTEWVKVVVWRNGAELVDNYVKKGAQLYVEGKLQTRSWDDSNGQKRYVTEVIASNIQMLGRKEGQSAPASSPAPSAPSYGNRYDTTPIPSAGEEETDDLPF